MKMVMNIAGLLLAVLVVVVLLLFLIDTTTRRQHPSPVEAAEEDEAPQEEAEKFASKIVEEDTFTVPTTAVELTEAMSAAGQAMATELDGQVPVVNATFPRMRFEEFVNAMTVRGVLFALSDPATGQFHRVVSTAPYRFQPTTVETLAAVNPRYCRISCDTGETRELLAAWQRQNPTAEGADILMFLPKRLEYAVLGSLASADPPPGAVASYHGEYQARRGGLRLEIREAVTKHGDAVAMDRLIDF